MKKGLVVFALMVLAFVMALSLTSCGKGECEHEAGEAVKENVFEGTCAEKSSYDSVTYCKLCKAEISRKKVQGALGNHVPGTAEREAVDIFDCKIGGTYEEVVYCKVDGCREEISRNEVTVAPAQKHGKSVTYIEDGFDCASGGIKYEITACSDCDAIISRTPTTAAAAKHNFVKRICSVCGAIEGSKLEYEVDHATGTCTVVGLGEADKDANIYIGVDPDYGYPVTAIAPGAFAGATKVARVRIAGSVESIGEDAFAGCTALKNVYIYDVKAWAEMDFGNEASNPLSIATTLYIDDVVTTKIVIPEGTSKIAPYAFCGSSAEIVYIPASVSTIGESAFSDCEGLKNVHFAGNVDTIEANAFASCTKLKNVFISDVAGWAVTTFKTNLSNPIYYAGNLFLNYELVENLEIPNGVTAIAPKAFIGISAKTISIPASVVTIGESAFARAKKLETVNIAGGVEVIGSYAFADSAVKEIALTESLKTIGANAFIRCINLAEIIIPENVTSIGDNAFAGCKSLASVTFGKALITVGAGAFESCASLVAIELSENVTSLGDRAFASCAKLVTVKLNAKLETIGEETFAACSSVKEIIVGESVTKIGFGAFKDCYSIETLSIPFVGAEKGNTANSHIGYLFGAAVYSDNNSVLPNSLKNVQISAADYIGAYAFYDCEVITNLVLCEELATIGAYAFDGCTGLVAVYVPDLAKWSQIDFENYCANPVAAAGNLYTYVTYDIVDDNTNEKVGVGFESELVTDMTIGGAGITEISSYAFYGLTSLVKLTVADGVTNIGNDAFSCCSALESVALPVSISYVGARAFDRCEAILTLDIADLAKWCSVDFADYAANPIYYAAAFKVAGVEVSALVIPDSVTEIGARAFMNYSGFTSVTLGAAVEKIGESAFEDCDAIAAIVLPDSVKEIGNSAFAGCTKLATVNLGEVEIIGNKAFKGCSAISALVIVDTVESIGHEAFSGCSAIAELTLGAALKTIGNSAFYGCKAVKSVTVPATVESIGSYAFANCDALETVTFADANGWMANGKAVDLANASAAELLTDALSAYSWSK